MKLPLVMALLIGCSAGDPVADKDAATPGVEGDRQLPPQGHVALKAWLGEAHYKAWSCEPEPHGARPPGAHGTNRICSNTALSTSESGLYPVGAASVKELWQNGRVTGFALGIKLAESSDAGSWYWYEAYGDSVIADGVNKSLCTGCHEDAPRDYVFTQVR